MRIPTRKSAPKGAPRTTGQSDRSDPTAIAEAKLRIEAAVRVASASLQDPELFPADAVAEHTVVMGEKALRFLELAA